MKATEVPAGSTETVPWAGQIGPLPAYCRVEGVLNRRTGVGGEEFGITFALAMPEKWNGDFLMQGGGGSNGTVMPPLGLNAAGQTSGLVRGFAVVSTDTGHKSRHQGFDFDFVRDQQAYLDFAYLANAEVAALTYLSPNTVKSYIRTIYRKIGVGSRTQAVLWGVNHGFSPDHHRIEHWRGGP